MSAGRLLASLAWEVLPGSDFVSQVSGRKDCQSLLCRRKSCRKTNACSLNASRYALIDEPLTGSTATICGGTGSGLGATSSRERHVYTSRSHRVRVQLLHTNNGAGYLLKFEGRSISQFISACTSQSNCAFVTTATIGPSKKHPAFSWLQLVKFQTILTILSLLEREWNFQENGNTTQYALTIIVVLTRKV